VKNFKFTEDYFRSYFIEINEKQILTKWHKRICNLINIEYDTGFLPHISLMYCDIPKEIKKQIEVPIAKGKSFKIRSIQITACDGEVENWNPVFELNIQE
jgi:hypothetical protein